MDHSTVMKSARQSIAEAVEADRVGNYKAAFAKYQTGISQFRILLKDGKSEHTTLILKKSIEEYKHRAEVLKVKIKSYEKQLHNFIVVLQYEKNGVNRRIVRKLQEYMERAEVFKMKGVGAAIVREKPNVKWSDVAGLERAKEALKEAVVLSVRFPHLFALTRAPWRRILLYGPPGTGKRFLSKAAATEADSTFFSVSATDLVSKWEGEGEELVRSLFDMARDQAPSIVFVDEVDSLCGARGEGEIQASMRIKTEFLVEMGGVGKGSEGVFVLVATNFPWSLDPAMRRRFEKRIYIPLPDKDARTYMFKWNLGSSATSLSERDLDILGEDSEGYSGAEISIVVREALMLSARNLSTTQFFRKDEERYFEPIAENPPCPYCPMKLTHMQNQDSNPECLQCGAIRMSSSDIPANMVKMPLLELYHLTHALEVTNPSVNPNQLVQFEEWTAEFGEEG